MKHQYSLSLLLSILFFILVQGNSEKCKLSDVQIQQSNIGRSTDKLDFVFEVEVKNLCSCTIKNVFVNSNGFATSAMVDPKLFRRESNGYLVNDGRSIASQSSIKFRYAWDHYFKMTPASLQANC
ncbi:Protein TAPETUM DETERMINANT 1 [Carex littledalei]|uniref:Protein TAPETUM DETERMINANT 1 n=1 Tax=Carex littledalei TaxID=544730 RepID=A0A833QWU9_9POAL|nr:Protein TAPETUM DETERMINANT 1 [Carex littledalei]